MFWLGWLNAVENIQWLLRLVAAPNGDLSLASLRLLADLL